MLKNNTGFLMNVGRKSGHVLFTGVSRDKMQEVKSVLKQTDNFFISSFITFGASDERKLNSLLFNCENIFQENLITRAYVATKFLGHIIKSSKISISRGIAKNCNECLSLIKNMDYVGMVKNLSCFPTLCDVVQQQEINGKLDMNVFLTGKGDYSLQRGINDYLSQRNPMGLKVYTSDIILPTSETTHESRLSIIKGDYDLDTSLTSIKFIPKQKNL